MSPTTPRRVHVSRELLANPDRAQYGDGLKSDVREIAFGTDLRPRMSTGVDHAYEPWMHPATERKRRDVRHPDRLLAEWGVHHLHLCTSPHPKLSGCKARSRHVLFAVFHRDDAYLIDVYDHESNGRGGTPTTARTRGRMAVTGSTRPSPPRQTMYAGWVGGWVGLGVGRLAQGRMDGTIDNHGNGVIGVPLFGGRRDPRFRASCRSAWLTQPSPTCPSLQPLRSADRVAGPSAASMRESAAADATPVR